MWFGDAQLANPAALRCIVDMSCDAQADDISAIDADLDAADAERDREVDNLACQHWPGVSYRRLAGRTRLDDVSGLASASNRVCRLLRRPSCVPLLLSAPESNLKSVCDRAMLCAAVLMRRGLAGEGEALEIARTETARALRCAEKSALVTRCLPESCSVLLTELAWELDFQHRSTRARRARARAAIARSLVAFSTPQHHSTPIPSHSTPIPSHRTPIPSHSDSNGGPATPVAASPSWNSKEDNPNWERKEAASTAETWNVLLRPYVRLIAAFAAQ
jgi:hypothetical protein